MLPPKLATPADAEEVLAWDFYVHSHVSPPRYLERVFPGERFKSPGKRPGLLAVPAARRAASAA